MIACTSNDLLSPLSGVIAGLTEIRNDEELFNSLTNQQKEIFQTAYACSSVMNRICTKSLQAMFPRDHRGGLIRRQSDLEKDKDDVDTSNQLRVSELVKHLHVVMDPFPKHVPIVITVDDAIPPAVVADELKVFRSIVNYLTNACSCTDTGSVHLKIFLKDGDEDDGSLNGTDDSARTRIVFLVEDTGPGVPIDEYPNLFKPIGAHDDGFTCKLAAFGKPNDAASADAPVKKAGLGLYSVAALISSIGGQYGFRPRGFSETGVQLLDEKGHQLKGSIFWFSIPLILPEQSHRIQAKLSSGKPSVEFQTEAKLPTESKQENIDTDMTWDAADEAAISKGCTHPVPKNQRKRSQDHLDSQANRMRRALIIDDSVVTRRTLSRMLNKLGFAVTEAVNGMDGLKHLQDSLFDLVLVDFLMPVMDGPDCVQQYRQFELSRRPWFDQYIVGISSHASTTDVERGIKVGMNDFRPKPITMKDLEEMVACQEYQFISSRLDSLAIDIAETESNAISSKKEPKSDSHKEQTKRVCLIVEGVKAISGFADHVAGEIGWSTVVVDSGEAGLRLLQMRNWDAVLLDDTLPGLSSCGVLDHFRDWEKKNRVVRQRNVYQMSSSFIPIQLACSTTVQLPSGFDGAIGKPITANVFRDFLSKSAEVTSSMSKDIVSR